MGAFNVWFTLQNFGWRTKSLPNINHILECGYHETPLVGRLIQVHDNMGAFNLWFTLQELWVGDIIPS